MSDAANSTGLLSEVAQSFVLDDDNGPDTCSADHAKMKPYWDKVAAISGGADEMRKQSEKYLKKLNLEDQTDYKDRIDNTPFTNVYEDISRNLAAKPFSREVKFEDEEDVDEAYEELFEDIDGRGNNLHVFAESTFHDGLDNAIDWILVDHTRMPPSDVDRPRTIAEEKELGARPYWVHVPGSAVIAAYSQMVKGRESFTHVRIRETATVREGYKEVVKKRIREFDRAVTVLTKTQEVELGEPTFKVWEEEEADRTTPHGKKRWKLIDSGKLTVGVIPMVPFFTGKREGTGWSIRPAMRSLIDMQLDAFKQESNLRNVQLLTCYPMLTANGLSPPTAEAPAPGTGKPAAGPRVPVGPRAVLWAPANSQGQNGSWDFIEPSAESIKVLQAELDTAYKNMREIGMQPLAESNQTVITSANVSVKAKSALQAWALRLKDALEQAFVITAMWLGEDPDSAPGIDVYKDFGVDFESGKELDTILSMRTNGDLSRRTTQDELKRRSVLSDSFDPEEEKERLAEEAAEMAAEEGMGEVDPETGELLDDPEPEEEGGEPLDPGQYKDASDIDAAALRQLFGDAAADALGLE